MPYGKRQVSCTVFMCVYISRSIDEERMTTVSRTDKRKETRDVERVVCLIVVIWLESRTWLRLFSMQLCDQWWTTKRQFHYRFHHHFHCQFQLPKINSNQSIFPSAQPSIKKNHWLSKYICMPTTAICPRSQNQITNQKIKSKSTRTTQKKKAAASRADFFWFIAARNHCISASVCIPWLGTFPSRLSRD